MRIERSKFFADPSSFPKVLYKYRDLSDKYGKRVLTDSELYLARPDSFNDPFDCRIPFGYYLLENHSENQKRYFPVFVKRHSPRLPINQQEEEVNRLIIEGRGNDHKWMSEMEDAVWKELNNRVGVFSMTGSEINNPMWAYYAANHTGYCIGFHSRFFLDKSSDFHMGGPVRYCSKFPILLPWRPHMENWYRQIFTKQNIWKHEEEYRLVGIRENGFTKSDDNDERIMKFNSDDVSQIILGYNMTNPIIREEVCDIARDRYPKAELLSAYPEKYSFNIGLKKIKQSR